MTLYALILGVGASMGLWQVSRRSETGQSSRAINAGLIVLAAGLAGGRAGYILLRWHYYSKQWIEAFQFWRGGLSLAGALVSGLIIVLILAAVWAISLRTLMDWIAPLFPPLSIAGWLGCMQAGCAYGPQLTGSPWWGVPLIDESGVFSIRFPLQPLAAFSLLVFFIWLERKPAWFWYPGKLGSLTCLVLGVNFFVFNAMRVDDRLRVGGFNIDSWASLGLTLFGLLLLLYAYFAHRRSVNQPEDSVRRD